MRTFNLYFNNKALATGTNNNKWFSANFKDSKWVERSNSPPG